MEPSTKPRRDLERAPRFFPFYYGWIIVAVGALGIVMSVPGQTMGVSVFTDHLIEAFQVDRTRLSFAYMIGTLASSLILPYAGKLLDRWGARRMIVLATGGLTASIGLLAGGSYLIEGFARILPAVSSSAVGFVIALFAFMGVRHFGQGQMTMIARTMIGRWFESRRGMAFAISGAFVAFGFGAAPLALSRLISTYGWRESLLILAAAELIMMALGFAFYRSGAIECGLPMEDGMKPPKRIATHLIARDWELSEVRRCGTFWLFCMAMTLNGTIVTAVIFHFRAICDTRGVDADEAYTLFLPIAFVCVIVEMLGSWLSDRCSVKYHLGLMQLALAIAALGLLRIGSMAGDMAIIVGLGFSGGLFATLNSVAWPRYFGTKHLGAVAGLNTGWVVFGCAFSPFLFSLSKSHFGDFNVALVACAALPAVLFVWNMTHRHKDKLPIEGVSPVE
jgi:MFS transporter, OFA family, oxalate/formate antiporter